MEGLKEGELNREVFGEIISEGKYEKKIVYQLDSRGRV